ncbi:hypothetical protein DTL21_19930 [Bremerella cremea]|uniref:DUF1570 domain-containing protein n=1 Tax=Blastopirellula marina TaxID=124 RepID=A0A2S8FJZ8_9BACT|nr:MULTISPECIES: hypothetical protein [Pirellulaceae]PQO32483.1 hypothetical protein C5Y83_19910 [Blastopirellula marina]RCS45550.1 hypothetical protein DTL21_19930 [Bremerella cremea]
MNRTIFVIFCIPILLLGCSKSESDSTPVAQSSEKQKPAPKPEKSKPPAVRSATVGDTTKPKEESGDFFGNGFMNSDRLKKRLKVGRIEPEVQFTADPAKLEAAGIRVIEGKHVQIYTDLESSASIDELPQVFDAAFPQWCEYFKVDPVQNADWKIKAVLMSGKDKFRQAGLFPDSLPEFLHGYYQGDAVWLLDQPSDYYRRHLLLHEGTHAFMYILLGGAGPPWYMEGMAEHFGTHTWDNGQLTTRVMPPSKEATPMWGRIKIIQDEVKEGKTLSLVSVMATPQKAFLENRPYAWCWGVCAFLDNHSLSKEAFREMVSQVKLTGGFSERLFDRLGAVMPKLSENWQVFTINADYGYDWERNEVVYQDSVPMVGETATAEIATDRGWQSTGIALEPNVVYEVRAIGQYEIRNDGQPWMCEPNGVTIHYWKGKPLGVLLGSLRNEHWNGTSITDLAKSYPVGFGTELYPAGPATLFLKVNESPAELADNVGKIQIQIKRLDKKPPVSGGQ